MKIYLDMDGVLADFDGAMLQHNIINRHDFIHKPKLEWTEEEAKLDVAVETVMKQRGFWLGIPVMNKATSLVDLSTLLGETFILTARPNGEEFEWVADEKRQWIREHFPEFDDEHFICCLRSEKKDYAKGNILVDDMKRNCYEWEMAGGYAILWQ
jgi:5'(3')-deoxyribonucleotidase